MTYLSVCSGIEAASVAWHPLGWRAAAFSEIEKFPSAVLKHRWPEVHNIGSLLNFKSWPDYAIDLLVGGTPCQSFSVAGLRKGMADPRGNLTLTFLACLARYRPKWVLWENVPGVLSDATGGFASLLGGLGKLGYGWAYRVLDAQYFGLAQRRRRVFVVGYLGDWRRACAVLFERASLCGHTAPSREAGKDVAGTISARTQGGGGLGTDFELSGGQTAAYGGNNTAGPIDVATAVNAHGGPHGRLDFESETFVTHALRGEGFDASEAVRGTPLVPVSYRASPNCGAWETGDRVDALTTGTDPTSHVLAFDTTQITSRENRCRPEPGDPCHPLAAQGHPPTVAFQERGRDGGRSIEIGGEVAFALTAPSGGGRAQERNIATGSAVRRLTPVECERLQGFPDGYTAIPKAADGPRYKALGNSMAVPVMHWIGQRIELVEAL